MSYNLKQCTILRRYDLANHICVLSIWIMKLCCWIKSVPYLYQNADYFITLSWLPLNSFLKLIRCIYKCAYVKGVGYTEVKIDAKRRLARRFIWRYKRRQQQLAQRLDITISKNVKVYNKNFILFQKYIRGWSDKVTWSVLNIHVQIMYTLKRMNYLILIL